MYTYDYRISSVFVIFLYIFTSGSSQSSDTGCLSGFTRIGDSCWRSVDEILTKSEAEEKCNSLGGQLPTLDTRAKRDLFYKQVAHLDSAFKHKGFHSEQAWVNAFSVDENGRKFVWEETGDLVYESAWMRRSLDPLDDCATAQLQTKSGKEYHTTLSLDKGDVLLPGLSTQKCTSKLFYFCEDPTCDLNSGKCWTMSDNPQSYVSAKNNCEKLGKQLPVLDTIEKLMKFNAHLAKSSDRLRSLSRGSSSKSSTCYHCVWVGARRSTSGQFQWLSSSGSMSNVDKSLWIRVLSGPKMESKARCAGISYSLIEKEALLLNQRCDVKMKTICRHKACKVGYTYGEGSICIRLISVDLKDQEAAKEACAEWGDHLPILDRESKVQGLREAVKNMPLKSTRIWLGIRSIGFEGTNFIWDNDVHYEDRTRKNNFDEYFGSLGYLQFVRAPACLNFAYKSSVWSAYSCREPLPFVCECPSCPDNYVPYLTSCFRFHSDQKLNMSKARELCARDGGSLPYLHSSQKLESMKRFVKKSGNDTLEVFVAMQKFPPGSKFLWDYGFGASRTDSLGLWETGYPKGEGRCVIFSFKSQKLMNVECNRELPVLCEKRHCPEGYKAAYGSCYKNMHVEVDPEEGRKKCFADGARVPVISSASRIVGFKHFLYNDVRLSDKVWVGMRLQESLGFKMAWDNDVNNVVSKLNWDAANSGIERCATALASTGTFLYFSCFSRAQLVCEKTVYAECPDDHIASINSCYRVSNTKRNKITSERYCSEITNERLPKVQTADQKTAISNIQGLLPNKIYRPWVHNPIVATGAKADKWNPRTYEWQDGTVLDYKNMDAFQPDGTSTCLGASLLHGRLRNIPCDKPVPFVCEKLPRRRQ